MLQYLNGLRPSWYWRHLKPSLLQQPTRQNNSWAILAERSDTSWSIDPTHTIKLQYLSPLSSLSCPLISVRPGCTPKESRRNRKYTKFFEVTGDDVCLNNVYPMSLREGILFYFISLTETQENHGLCFNIKQYFFVFFFLYNI